MSRSDIKEVYILGQRPGRGWRAGHEGQEAERIQKSRIFELNDAQARGFDSVCISGEQQMKECPFQIILQEKRGRRRLLTT